MDKEFEEFVEDIFRTSLNLNPISGTYLGLHDYNTIMPVVSKYSFRFQITFTEKMLDMLQEFPDEKLSPSNRIDKLVLERLAKIWLFDLKELETWRKDFDAAYLISGAIYGLVIKNYAPFNVRLSHITSRVKETDRIVRETISRVDKPVKTWAKIDQEVSQMTIGFFELITNIAKSEGVDKETMDTWIKTKEKAKESLTKYYHHLEEVAQKAEDNWALGKEKFVKLLRLRGIKESLEELTAMAEKIKAETLEELEKIAKEIDPTKSWKEVLNMIRADHPKTAEEVIEAYKKAMNEAREIVKSGNFVPYPQGEELIVTMTPPPFQPLLPIAAYLNPGKFEKQVGVYMVTPLEDRLKEHNYASIKNTSFHEAYPGHHLQLVWANINKSLARILVQAPEFVEGWAHYVEELMVTKGYGDKKVRMAQLEDQLFRCVRVIVDIKMSTGEFTFEDAVNYMTKELGWSRSVIESEVKRYTKTPGYQLSYLYGKVKIKQLREKVKSILKDRFNEYEYHKAILEEGNLPLDILEDVVIKKLTSSN